MGCGASTDGTPGQFKNGTPKVQGTFHPLFPEGECFRIVANEGHEWHFYNDTTTYQMKIKYTFGSDSQLEPMGGHVSLEKKADGTYVATMTVPPLQTMSFVRGVVNGFESDVIAVPVSTN